MTRIIISKHDNGRENVVAGWDRPLMTAFVDSYDDQGDIDVTNGPMVGEHLTPAEAANILIAVHKVDGLTADRVEDMLEHHRGLQPPDSNHVFDLTSGA